MQCPRCHGTFNLSSGHMCNFLTGGISITPVYGYMTNALVPASPSHDTDRSTE